MLVFVTLREFLSSIVIYKYKKSILFHLISSKQIQDYRLVIIFTPLVFSNSSMFSSLRLVIMTILIPKHLPCRTTFIFFFHIKCVAVYLTYHLSEKINLELSYSRRPRPDCFLYRHGCRESYTKLSIFRVTSKMLYKSYFKKIITLLETVTQIIVELITSLQNVWEEYSDH